MSPARLQGVLSTWEYEDHNGDPVDEPVQRWHGSLRIVHRQRARKLRRRGEHLMDLRPRNGRGPNGYEGRAQYAWFVEPTGPLHTSGAGS